MAAWAAPTSSATCTDTSTTCARSSSRAGLVDGDDRWTGGDADLWVLGDLVDRGPDGIGVVRFVRSLQEQAPDRVRVLMGNHEALMLGYHLFPDTRFADVWLINGGHEPGPGAASPTTTSPGCAPCP